MRDHSPPPAPQHMRQYAGHWRITSLADVARTRAEALRLCVRTPPSVHPPGSPALAEAAQRLGVVFTELVSNALLHASPPIGVTLLDDADAWLLVVTDRSPELSPVPRQSRPTDAHGRGLTMALTLASGVGWYADHDDKVVWAVITDTPTPSLLTRLTG